ncbi:MAG: glycosyltransferase [Candidatus Omnitrophota bacterium]
MSVRNPLVSVIIPSLDGYRQGNVPKLLEDLSKQSFQDFEVHVVKGISPCSKAHNVGAKLAKGEILVFFDDDVRLGTEKVVENLIKPLIEDKTIGITGASQLIPPDSNEFQKHCVKILYRSQFPIVNKITETDMVTHAGMAILKKLYLELGGENGNLIRGDDPEFRYRVRQSGHRIVVVPNTWVFHPMYRNLGELLKARFQHGVGAAHDSRYFPNLIFEVPPPDVTDFVPRRSLPFRIIRFIVRLIRLLLTFQLIGFLANLSYAIGFSIGLFKRYK